MNCNEIFYFNFTIILFHCLLQFFQYSPQFRQVEYFYAGRKELAEFGGLLFIGDFAFCGLNKNFLCLICNVLYCAKFFLVDFSLHILLIVLRCVDLGRCFTLRKISNLAHVLLKEDLPTQETITVFTPKEIEEFKTGAFSKFRNGKPKYQQPPNALCR